MIFLATLPLWKIIFTCQLLIFKTWSHPLYSPGQSNYMASILLDSRANQQSINYDQPQIYVAPKFAAFQNYRSGQDSRSQENAGQVDPLSVSYITYQDEKQPEIDSGHDVVMPLTFEGSYFRDGIDRFDGTAGAFDGLKF